MLMCDRAIGFLPRQNARIRSLSSAAAILIAIGTGHQALAQASPADQTASDDEIVVSAQRHNEVLSKVPLSIVTYSQELMDQQNIRSIDDIARLTPALNFSTTAGVTGNNGSNIAIRGLKSDVGSATTALYIDDTPIQMRNVGYYGGNPYPRVFDLERVEVLRGPQGTQFGASAEGGAVRFITTSPNFDKLSVYSRSQLSFTQNGSPSFETGLAVGAPITPTLAFRASGWYQHVGGYVDRVSPTTGIIQQQDVNYQDNYSVRLALGWKATPDLTVTPKLFFQRTRQNSRDDYWEGYGNAAKSNYVTGTPQADPTTDKFWLPSLTLDWQHGTLEVVSTTSYFARDQQQTLSYGTYFGFINTGDPFGTYADEDPSNSQDFLTMKQRNFTQEVRVQSYGNKTLDWSVGGFFSKTKQSFSNFTQSGLVEGTLVFGSPQYQGVYSYVNLVEARDTQVAGFASVDFKPVDRLKITAALRYTHDVFNFVDTVKGPYTGGTDIVSPAHNTEGDWTPKFGIDFQVTPTTMLYASATKGFRPAGAQPSTYSSACDGDLATLGMTNVPSAYKSDSLWSYEAGAKGKALAGLLNFDVGGYLLKWRNMQQSIRLPTCSFSFIDNLGNATGRGVEAAIEVKPAKGVVLGGNIGYTNLTYDDNVYGGNGLLLKAAGQRISGPIWSGHLYATVERPVSAAIDGYLRLDYSFASSSALDTVKGAYGYDPGLYALGGTNFLQLRFGGRMGGIDASLFVDNLTNSRDLLARNHDGVGSYLYFNQTYRPRTIGATLQYRY